MDSISIDPKTSKPVLIVTPESNNINPKGDVFCGWLLSQLDIAGAICASKRAKSNVATIAVKEMLFLEPLFMRDIVSIYAVIEKVGKTSITIKLAVYAERDFGAGEPQILAAEAIFVYVAIEKPGVKKNVDPA